VTEILVNWPPKRRDDEHKLQCMVVDYIYAAAKPGTIPMAVTNEGIRSLRMGARMKRQGLQPGAPDMGVLMPNGRVGWLEFKTRTGRQSVEQKGFQSRLLRIQHPYAIIRTFDEAEKVLRLWGALK